MKTLYITDLDGTLLNSKAELSQVSSVLIEKIIKSGALFSIATARTHATVMNMFRDVPLNCPIVLMNGVTVYSPKEKEIVISHSINEVTAKKIMNIYDKYNQHPLLYFKTKTTPLDILYRELTNDYQRAYVNKRNNFDEKKFYQIHSPADFSGNNLLYMTSLDSYDALKDIHKEICEIEDVCSVFYRDNYTDLYFLETFSKSASKALSALEVKRLIGADKIVAFGDNLNDIPLFEVADECYAVEGASEELKKIATGIIGSNDDDAVARFIFEQIEV